MASRERLLDELQRCGRELLELEYPRPGLESRHPLAAGRILWRRLRELLEELDELAAPEPET